MDWSAVIATLKPVGFGALGFLVVLWLIISFTKPSRGRAVTEWIAACSMYVGLLCLFTTLVWRAYSSDNWFAVVAFGLLEAIFVCGLVVSFVMTFRELASGPGGAAVDATH